MSEAIVYVIEFALLFKQFEFEVFGKLRVAAKDFLDLSKVLLGDLMAKELVNLMDKF